MHDVTLLLLFHILQSFLRLQFVSQLADILEELESQYLRQQILETLAPSQISA